MTRPLCPETSGDAFLLVRALNYQEPVGSPELSPDYPLANPFTELETIPTHIATQTPVEVAQLDQQVVVRARDMAERWLDFAIEGRPLPGREVGARVLRVGRPGAEEVTGALPIEEITDPTGEVPLAELPETKEIITGRRPKGFDAEEREVVLTALHALAASPGRHTGDRREVWHFLARRAPNPVVRMGYRLALMATVAALRHQA